MVDNIRNALLKKGLLIPISCLCLLYVAGVYLRYGKDIILSSYYKIPVGLLISIILLCLSYNKEKMSLLTDMGKYSMQIYLFQVAGFLWIRAYLADEAIPLMVNCIAFVCMTAICAVVPVILCRKMRGTALYCMLFNPYDFAADRFSLKTKQGI